MDIRQQKGRISETILTEYFLRRGYYVYVPLAAHGPVDVIAIHLESGKLILVDAKTNQYRTAISNTGMASTAGSQDINNRLQDLVAISDMKSKAVVDDKASKTDAAIVDFNKQKNALLTAYLDTTGQTHPGSYALTDLQELLDQYEGQV